MEAEQCCDSARTVSVALLSGQTVSLCAFPAWTVADLKRQAQQDRVPRGPKGPIIRYSVLG